MIIADDNFATIVAAVEEGRGIYDNIRKTLQYLLAGNTGELLLMTLCVAVGSFALQVWSQHNAIFGRFLKTQFIPLTDCFLLLALGALPLLVLEMVKLLRHPQSTPLSTKIEPGKRS